MQEVKGKKEVTKVYAYYALLDKSYKISHFCMIDFCDKNIKLESE